MATEQRLIDAIELANFFGFMRKMWSGSEIMNVIDEAETVDARPVVHGRWINKTRVIHGHVDYMFVCSACGFIHWDSITDTFDFCPNCGAHMDGG